MADVDVDHGGIIMVSAVVVGNTADGDSSADHDLSKVTTNLPSMTIPSSTMTPGWVVIILSLIPLLW